MKYKTKDLEITDEMVANSITYKGKPTTRKDLLRSGISESEISRRVMSSTYFILQFSHLQVGLVMQYFDGGWHSEEVIVKINDRFVWLKSLDNLDDDSKPRRCLKKDLYKKGYSLEYCGYGDSKLIGKIINI